LSIRAARLATLHAACFTVPAPWTQAAFASLLASPGTFLIDRGEGFLLGRVVLDEAEILTLAVAPHARRKGLARQMLAEFEETAKAKGADRALLEVAANNPPARALYSAAGYNEAGLRRGYYAIPGSAPAIDALTLCKEL
jgi:ribosomal-protein-alanine N-acetyltransferase